MVDGMREALQGDSLVVELVGSFLRDTPLRLQPLTAGLLDDDLVQAATIAHDVKSSAQMFGATRLGDVCAAVEVIPRGGPARGDDRGVRPGSRRAAAHLAELD